MNLLEMLSRVIDTGVTRVRTGFEAIGIHVSGYSRVPPAEDSDDDIEMYGLGIRDEADLFGGMPSIYANNSAYDNPHQSSQPSRASRYFSCVTVIIQRFSTMLKLGSRCIQAIRNRRIVEVLRVSYFFTILTVVALITLAVRILGPGYLDYDQNEGKLHNVSLAELAGLTGDQQHHAIHFTDSAYVPGFYLVPELDLVPGILCESCTAAPTAIHSTSTSALSIESSDTAFVSPSTLEKRNDIEQSMVLHHAYPIHAGNKHKSGQILRIKLQLEHCASNMLRKLDGQGLEITAGFEFALHDCKSAIDTALAILYPSAQARSKGVDLSTAIYGVVPRGTQPSSINIPKYPHPSKDANAPHRDSCAKDLCNWVSPTNLDRCYHRNETDLALNGKHSYLNDSVDDFKPNAPLECNLCLPYVDEEEIAMHCKEVSVIETNLFKYLTIALGVSVVVLLVMIPFRARWRKSGRLGKGRRLDKSMIGRPVRIPDQGEGVEGAFENPRPAPLPPRA